VRKVAPPVSLDAKYMGDRLRSTRELEAALLALSVLGNADVAIPRERVTFPHRHGAAR
jgi:hypothetical protein